MPPRSDNVVPLFDTPADTSGTVMVPMDMGEFEKLLKRVADGRRELRIEQLKADLYNRTTAAKRQALEHQAQVRVIRTHAQHMAMAGFAAGGFTVLIIGILLRVAEAL